MLPTAQTTHLLYTLKKKLLTGDYDVFLILHFDGGPFMQKCKTMIF